jgi:DNA polymerase-3 subunit gamma/tau
VVEDRRRAAADDTMSDAEGSKLSPDFDLAGAPAGATTYRVLARKYRPISFDDLIGQDAMVRTITNAFETGRIPQAWILTGVRGVGKTTTARILARALNYELPDGSVKAPTTALPVLGMHCPAIIESRHIDVIEMDAASHNGVDDIRQINDAIRYKPATARYKVYILDEVHMLTPQAFNALLKTLEEPPPHAKFVFATTEIRKVPVTVLSRCQRFDLRRVETQLLMKHLQGIAAREGIEIEINALALIARAADGSVRDALSLLDQAIAHAAGPVRAEEVRQMLGLADRSRTIDLFDALMRGDMAAALQELRDQYDIGADPAVVVADLAEFTHFVTRVKVVPAVADDVSLAETERTRGRAFAEKLSMRILARTWQMLFKGMAEVKETDRPLAAAEMLLVRIAYAADLPTPDEVIRALDGAGGTAQPRLPANGGGRAGATAVGLPAPRYETPRGAPRGALAPAAQPLGDPVSNLTDAPPSAPPLVVARFDELIALAVQKRDLAVKTALERDVRLVRCEDGRLEIALEPNAVKSLVNELARKFSQWTNRRWMVIVSAEAGAPTLKSQQEARQAELKTGIQADPLVQAVLTRFPGAEIVGVRTPESAPVAEVLPPAEADADVPDPMHDLGPEPPPVDDSSVFGAHRRPDDVDDDF